jgi:hypothetical protein
VRITPSSITFGIQLKIDEKNSSMLLSLGELECLKNLKFFLPVNKYKIEVIIVISARTDF